MSSITTSTALPRRTAGPLRARLAHVGPSGWIGLSIVASLVAAHDGQVSVESAPGRGARFRVVLPRYVPTDTPRSDRATAAAS